MFLENVYVQIEILFYFRTSQSIWYDTVYMNFQGEECWEWRRLKPVNLMNYVSWNTSGNFSIS